MVSTVKITPRVKNYIHNDDVHNATQDIESIQLEFAKEEDKIIFLKSINQKDLDKSILYDGYGLANQPILQFTTSFINNYGMVQIQ